MMTWSWLLLDVLLPLGIVISLLALVHCVVARKGVAWFLIIVLLGPFGGLVYLADYFNLLKFGPEKGPTSTGSTATRRCPRCQGSVGVLYDFEDGRQVIRICAMCKSEMELQQSGFTMPKL